MNFKETEDQRAIRATVRDFAGQEILPHRMEWDEGQVFPRALFSKMGELGLMGMLVPVDYGGAGMGYFEYKIPLKKWPRYAGQLACPWRLTIAYAPTTFSCLALKRNVRSTCRT